MFVYIQKKLKKLNLSRFIPCYKVKKALRMQNLVAKINIKNDYDIGTVIGSGTYGDTVIATDRKTGEKVAIKVINKDNLKKNLDPAACPEDRMMREINLVKLCNHPNIIRCIDFYVDDATYYFVMEYVSGGELYEHITTKDITMNQARKIFAQLVSCIEYCHGNLITHRDIKPENILLSNADDLSIKLIDFGLANYIKTTGLHNSFCGSPEYAAPEIILRKEYNPMKVDIWSIGIILNILVTGGYPWADKSMLKSITEYKFTFEDVGDNSLVDLLQKIFVPPEERITIKKIKEHPWMQGFVLPSHLPPRSPIEKIDCRVVKTMIKKLGFDEVYTLMSIWKGSNNQETAIYYLLLERLKVDEHAIQRKQRDKKKQITKIFRLSAKNKGMSKSESSLGKKFYQLAEKEGWVFETKNILP